MMSQPHGTTSTQDSASQETPATPLIAVETPSALAAGTSTTDDNEPKAGKRRFFGLGKKKEGKPLPNSSPSPLNQAQSSSTMPPPEQPTAAPVSQPVPSGKAPTDLRPRPQNIPISPTRHAHPSTLAASPSRIRSSSPRLHSPASSEIFERNVQEPAPISTLQNELSPAHIPAHFMTEDLIPPALEASAQAITSDMRPDEVEIVMSSTHQPAAVSVLEGSASHADLKELSSPLQKMRSDDSEPSSSPQQSGLLPSLGGGGGIADEDTASNYGQLDPTDVRRLSFISFADVVQSEHIQPGAPTSALSGEAGSRDSLHMGSFSSKDGISAGRTASPLRSPRSPSSTHSPRLSGAGLVSTPPPTSDNRGQLSAEQSPVRSIGLGSPIVQHGELTIETMSQAVRKTVSGDLGIGVGSVAAGSRGAMSPVPDERQPRSRTNT